MLERVKVLLDQGLKNEDVARETGLSVRQVQRYKAALARCPEVPKTRGELIELLRRKAQQGDLLAIRLLLNLPEPREEFNLDEAAKRLLVYFFHVFSQGERGIFKDLLRAAIKRATRLQAKGIEFPSQAAVEAEALAMQREAEPGPHGPGPHVDEGEGPAPGPEAEDVGESRPAQGESAPPKIPENS